MNVNQITDKIKEIAISLETVNSVFEGDVYDNWNSSEIKYGSFNVGLQNVSNDGNLCTYTFVFYYGDRLTQDKSNANSIYSDGVNTIQSVINVLNYMQFDISEQINYTPFEQKFMDYLAGVYATVNIVTSSSLGFCNMDDYNIEEIIEIVKNGIYDVTNYTKAVVNVIPQWGTIEGDINEQEDLIELIDGKINTLELPVATRNTLGGVIIGNGVNITDDGVLSCNIGGASPITVSRGVNGFFLVGVVKASKSHTGVVKIGDGLNVSNDGTISVPLPDLSNYLKQGSNNLTSNLVLYGKDYLSNVTVNNDNAGLSGKSLHKVSGTDEFDRGIFYKFTPDNIDFQNATTDVDGNIDSVTSQYKQTTKNIELNAEKVIVNPTSAFNVNGTMNVVATDKTTKFNNNKIEAKVQNTFTIKDGSDNKIFETKSSQTKINGRFDVTEPERGNILSLKKDGFETKVSGTSGVLNWQKMSAGGNPFAFGVENKSNINNGSKTAFLNTLPDGDIYVYGIGGYDGLSTGGNKSLQTVINDLENGGGGGIATKNAQIRVRINDCSTYENITVYVATSTGTYKQQITSMPSGDTVKDFDFDIQYTNANPLVTISVYSDTRTPSTIDYTGFWILYDYFSYEDVFNQDLSPIPLSLIPLPNNYSHFNGNYAGFSFQINLTDYDINTDGRVQVCNVQTSTLCYAEDTLITLSDGTTKMVQDITYDDVLKVWNFDEGKSDSAKPIWIKVEQTANQYALVKLSDGNSIKLVGSDGKYHCMFDMDEQKFNHAIDCIGHNVYTENGIVKVESLEIVNEPVKFYNIVTNVHLNCYANHILTSTEKNNIYPINDMKFIKDNREFKPYEAFKKYGITLDDYNGWRLAEQPMSVEECVEFIKQRKNTMKIKHI